MPWIWTVPNPLPRTRKPLECSVEPAWHAFFFFGTFIEAFRRPCLPFIGNGFNLLFLICNSFAFAFTRETERGSDSLAFYDTLTAGKSRIGTRLGSIPRPATKMAMAYSAIIFTVHLLFLLVVFGRTFAQIASFAEDMDSWAALHTLSNLAFYVEIKETI